VTPLQTILDALDAWIDANGTDPYNTEYVIEPMTIAISNALNCEPETSPRAQMSAHTIAIMERAGIAT